MRLDKITFPDWRDPAVYEDLIDADRACFAWEWLRRDPEYRTAAVRASYKDSDLGEGICEPARWGLHAFENPGLASALARPMWTTLRYAGVLAADVVPASPTGPRIDLRVLSSYLTRLSGSEGREHLLFGDGKRIIRLDLHGGSIARGGKSLRFRIDGLPQADAPLLTLQRLIALIRTGRFATRLHRNEARARYWILALRAADAMAEGACQREIAGALLGLDSALVRWRMEEPNARGRAQRLVQHARRMTRGGFAAFLR